MEIVKANKEGLKKAIFILRKGGTVVYPTDTAYALGGKFNSKKVTAAILKIKKRKDPKFTLICSSLYQVEKNFKINLTTKKIVKKYWPGPVSLVVNDRYAVRVPKKKIAQELAKGARKPIIATSANLSGGSELYDSKAVIRVFKNKKNQPDLLIDFGKIAKVKPSTIIQASSKSIKVLRQGVVKVLVK